MSMCAWDSNVEEWISVQAKDPTLFSVSPVIGSVVRATASQLPSENVDLRTGNFVGRRRDLSPGRFCYRNLVCFRIRVERRASRRVWRQRIPSLDRTATWLILPVVICLSQRLSHACLSTSLTKVKPRMAH